MARGFLDPRALPKVSFYPNYRAAILAIEVATVATQPEEPNKPYVIIAQYHFFRTYLGRLSRINNYVKGETKRAPPKRPDIKMFGLYSLVIWDKPRVTPRPTGTGFELDRVRGELQFALGNSHPLPAQEP